jgi:hypothetical protein
MTRIAQTVKRVISSPFITFLNPFDFAGGFMVSADMLFTPYKYI